ncbi:MAG: hypothetical protein OXG58_03370, partial [Gemmatimonadetes bacterium]|nr:hypothetical protein [Gemmatimonadota bacterium]MCY3943209.1 hypothetical protein [Gemmatimonadota bacterium]
KTCHFRRPVLCNFAWPVTVLDPGGEAFRVTAPQGAVFRAVDGDRVWATRTNDLDVPFIVLYELAGPGECA